MKSQKLLIEIEDSIANCDVERMLEGIANLHKNSTDENTCVELVQLFSNNYTSRGADAHAYLLENIFRTYPEFAFVRFPENYFFKLAVIKGSTDFYDCYMEVMIDPFLATQTADEKKAFLDGLFKVALSLVSSFFPEYKKTIRGIDYNGPFGYYEKDSNVYLIHQQDYEYVNGVVEMYNAIIGRRDILSDLEKRVSGK
ncbi:MAG: hypothetical protein WCJ03_05580 [Bacteroidales bacterium]